MMNDSNPAPLILITRPEARAQALAQRLDSLPDEINAEIRIAPAQTTAPVDDSAQARELISSRKASSLWVFVSTAAVEHGLALMDSSSKAALDGRCIAVGPATGEALQAAGVADVQIPDDHRSEGLLRLESLCG